MEAVVMLRPEEWRDFQNEMKAHVTREIESIKSALVERPVDLKAAAAHLILTESGFRKRIQKRKFPAKFVHKKDGALYFFPSELNQYILGL